MRANLATEGITWVGANVITATDSVISSTQTRYSNFMESKSDVPSISGESNVDIDKDIFFDASDNLSTEENMPIVGEVSESFT